MTATRAVKYLSRILFFCAVFFTAVCFCETWRQPFFINFNYKALKFILCVILPSAATLINYLCEKSFVYMGRACAVISTLFCVMYIIDDRFIGYIACFGDFMIIFHLAYGLISIFSVFLVCTMIKYFSRGRENGYGRFYNDYFMGFAVMLAFVFVLIYFVIRDYSGERGYTLNLVPFCGELGEMFNGKGSMLSALRTVGNVMFYTAMAVTVTRFARKRPVICGVAFPCAVSLLSEALQYVLKCGDADVDDFITNLLGAFLGVIIYKFIIYPLLNQKENTV